MQKKLVSIITPSYNCGEFCDNYFNGILNQTYDNIELIYIIDGSTDDTLEKVKEYEKKLKEKKIKFIYKYKENGGVCTAINVGLKLFSGDYVVFHDADDYYNPTAIEDMVNFLENNLDYAVVRFNLQLVSEDGKKIKTFFNKKDILNEWVLDDIALGKKFAYTGMMYRANYLKEEIPSLNIDLSPYGQNYQLLIPIVSKYKCGYINKILLNYLVRKNSLSHLSKDVDINKKIKRNHVLKESLMNELKKIDKLKLYEDDIKIELIKNDYIIYAVANDKRLIVEYRKLKEKKKVGNIEKIIYVLYKIKMLNICILLYEKIKGESL